MLFLLNDTVLDIGDPETTAETHYKVVSKIEPRRLRARDVVALCQALYFEWDAKRPSPKAALATAATLASKTDANAALFIRPKTAKSPSDVIVRLADVPITTLANLYQLQGAKPIAPKIVNDAIWMAA